jgi:hypothetical protein
MIKLTDLSKNKLPPGRGKREIAITNEFISTLSPKEIHFFLSPTMQRDRWITKRTAPAFCGIKAPLDIKKLSLFPLDD